LRIEETWTDPKEWTPRLRPPLEVRSFDALRELLGGNLGYDYTPRHKRLRHDHWRKYHNVWWSAAEPPRLPGTRHDPRPEVLVVSDLA
jgi:hypothetical protein